MIKYLLASWFGAIILYIIVDLIHKMWAIFLPKLPEEVIKQLLEVERKTREMDWYGNSDIDRLDDMLTEAEIEKPGSTLRVYLARPETKIGRVIGSIIVSFIIMGWFLGLFPPQFLSIAGIIFGHLFFLLPFLLWSISRPRAM